MRKYSQPLSVGVHACRRAEIKVGQNVLITGAGPIGLVSLLVAKAFGASKVCVTGREVYRYQQFVRWQPVSLSRWPTLSLISLSVDINEQRLQVAKELGADTSVFIKSGVQAEQLVGEVQACFGGSLPEVTIECSGAEASVNLAILVSVLKRLRRSHIQALTFNLTFKHAFRTR